MKLIYLTFTLLLLDFLAFGQLSTDNYIPLKCKGDVPEAFLIDKNERYPSVLNESTSPLQNQLIVRELLHGGHVMFGDEITEYVNSIAHDLLKNDAQLKSKLSFYVFKSAEALSFSTESGIVFLSTGLISQLAEENQLAFAIAHEIGHFTLEHKNYSYVGNAVSDVRDVGTFEIKKTFQTFFIRQLEEKKRADEYAVGLMARSKYNLKTITSYFDVLTYAYLPYEEQAFDSTFFNYDTVFVIPDLKLPELTEIDPYNFNDKNRENAVNAFDVRKRNVFEKIKEAENTGKKEITDIDEFKRIRDLARFEIIRINLIDRQYLDAINHSYIMLQKYPNNDYLMRSITKALYAIATYKINHRFNDLNINENQGEGSYLNLFFDALNTEQISVLSLLNIKKYLDKHPDDEFIISLQKSLIRNMKKVSKFSYSSFANKFVADADKKEEIDATAMTSKYDRIAKAKKMKGNTENASNFHLFILDLVDSDKLISNTFQKPSKSIYAYETVENPSVLSIDPILIYENSEYGINLLKTENEDRKLSYAMAYTGKIGPATVKPYSRRNITATDVADFNTIAGIKIWFSEALPHLRLEDFVSLESDYFMTFAEENKIDFICYGKGTYKTDADIYSRYRITIFDLRNGHIRCGISKLPTKQFSSATYARYLREAMECLR